MVAPAPAPAAPPITPEPSLVDGATPLPAAELTPAEKLVAAKALIAAAEAAADPNGGKAWLLAEGVMGQGEKPGWLKSDKYKSVSAQAEAYVALESRFGSFVGAPKDGKYEFKPPEGITFNMDHPLMAGFNQWATEKQLSQEGYTQMLGMLAQYEASRAPDMKAVLGRLGDNAGSRINTAVGWVKANLGDDGTSLFQAATRGGNADAVFKLVEQLISKSGQVRMPKPGPDVPSSGAGNGLADIQKAHGERLPNGKLRVNEQPGFRAEIEKRYRDFYASQEQ